MPKQRTVRKKPNKSPEQLYVKKDKKKPSKKRKDDLYGAEWS